MTFKKTVLVQALLGASLISVAGMAQAESKSDWSTSANVLLTSDYVWRGYTQSLEDPALQGGLDLSHNSGFYVGVWASSIKFVKDGDPSDGASTEADVYFGYSTELANGVGVDVGYNRYIYPGSNSNLNYDFGELYTSVSYKMLSLSYNYSNDFFGAAGKAHHLTLGVEHEINGVGISASVSRQILSDQDDSDYTHWSLGASKSLIGLDFALTYTGTDVDDMDDPDGYAGNNVAFSVGKTF